MAQGMGFGGINKPQALQSQMEQESYDMSQHFFSYGASSTIFSSVCR